jgi:hypothetical protein
MATSSAERVRFWFLHCWSFSAFGGCSMTVMHESLATIVGVGLTVVAFQFFLFLLVEVFSHIFEWTSP